MTLLQYSKMVSPWFCWMKWEAHEVVSAHWLPDSVLAVDLGGEIQVSAIAEPITNLHKGIYFSVCATLMPLMLWKHVPWKTYMVGTWGDRRQTRNCLLQPKPTPANQNEEQGKEWALSTSWCPTSSVEWLCFVFCVLEISNTCQGFLPVRCALGASMVGPAQSTGMVPGRGTLRRGGLNFMFLCVWAEVGFASGLEEERGLWRV